MYTGVAIDGLLAGKQIESDKPQHANHSLKPLYTDIVNLLKTPCQPTQFAVQNELYQYDEIEGFGIWTIREPKWVPSQKHSYYIERLIALVTGEGVNYAQLLEKYMAHIGRLEGIHFIPHRADKIFNELEIKALERASEESEKWEK